MTDALKILGRLASKGWRRKGMWSMRNIGMGRTTFRLVDDPDYHALRTAIERQGEELAQARARIARLDDSHALLLEAADKHLPGLETLRHQAERVMYETDRQSLAAVKAETLREAADKLIKLGQDGVPYFSRWLKHEADRIEKEANTCSNPDCRNGYVMPKGVNYWHGTPDMERCPDCEAKEEP